MLHGASVNALPLTPADRQYLLDAAAVTAAAAAADDRVTTIGSPAGVRRRDRSDSAASGSETRPSGSLDMPRDSMADNDWVFVEDYKQTLGRKGTQQRRTAAAAAAALYGDLSWMDSGQTRMPLLVAAEERQIAKAHFLLSRGADLGAALLCAIDRGDSPLCWQLLQLDPDFLLRHQRETRAIQSPASVEDRDFNTYLVTAAAQGHAGVCSVVLEYGATPSATALISAATAGRAGACRVILDRWTALVAASGSRGKDGAGVYGSGGSAVSAPTDVTTPAATATATATVTAAASVGTAVSTTSNRKDSLATPLSPQLSRSGVTDATATDTQSAPLPSAVNIAALSDLVSAVSEALVCASRAGHSDCCYLLIKNMQRHAATLATLSTSSVAAKDTAESERGDTDSHGAAVVTAADFSLVIEPSRRSLAAATAAAAATTPTSATAAPSAVGTAAPPVRVYLLRCSFETRSPVPRRVIYRAECA